jgi:hypothetical protein
MHRRPTRRQFELAVEALEALVREAHGGSSSLADLARTLPSLTYGDCDYLGPKHFAALEVVDRLLRGGEPLADRDQKAL